MARLTLVIDGLRPWLGRGLLTLALVVAQVSLLPSLPFGWIARVDLLVVLTVYCTMHIGVRSGLGFALAAGFLFDLYQPGGFGVHAVSLAAAAAAVDFVARRLVTNRTLSALLALGLVASLTALTASMLGNVLATVAALTVWPWSHVPSWRWWIDGSYGLAGQLALLALVLARRGGSHPRFHTGARAL